ncbi:unnamed protein product [Rotaria socialis]|uniref:Uncharacterized protein n=1 Tax=Rotaria socialis TaxID=392032 RepID=A0A820TMX3_9BILA|nr:unnamed protein product [Rotaria socialis]CAF3598782.1 unnamed protein product [Rotaria socialis]CAF4320059.1 unnamed protein product [Rotaria socialis]CAF4472989.1 unnamed protein product [Rotaria socialis]
MNRKLRCGRLIRTTDGILKEVELKHGGGSRFCPWNDKDMDFQTVHGIALNRFELNDRKYKTQLYDFNQRVLDINAYENFSQYIERFGLNTNSTILYLCTIESLAHKNEPPTKTKDTMVTTITSSEPHKTDANQQQTHKSSLKFEFKRSINNLIKHINSLMEQKGHDQILIELLQNICIIKGYIWSTIDKLQKQLRRSHEFIQLMQKHDILLYTNNVKNACDKCQSIQELLTSNKNKFNRIHIFSPIMNLFPGILRNLKRLLVLNINLYDEQSLNDVKRKIVSIENKISQILDEQGVNNFNIELNQQIEGSCRKAFRTIEFLLVIPNRYQMQAQQTNRYKYSRWSSPPRLFNETRQSIPPKKQK